MHSSKHSVQSIAVSVNIYVIQYTDTDKEAEIKDQKFAQVDFKPRKIQILYDRICQTWLCQISLLHRTIFEVLEKIYHLSVTVYNKWTSTSYINKPY